MAKTKISEFSATPGNNTDIDGINIAEGCAPSGINDAIRELMAQLKDWQAGTSNDPYVVGSSGSLTLSYGTANGVPYLNGSKVLTTGSALTFDGTNLGIGTSSPATKADIVGASGVTSFTGTSFLGLQVRGATSTNDYSGIGFSTNGQGSPTAKIGAYFSGSGSYLQFGTSNSYGSGVTNTAMTIDFSGNVGIGTSSPNARLHIEGSTSSVIALQVQNTEGTGSRFDFYANGSASGLGGDFNFRNTIYQWVGSGIDLWSSTGNLRFGTNNTERARIDSSGNVGIGTSSPASQLDVSKTGDAVVSLTSAGVQRYQLITRSGGRFDFQDQSAGATRWSVDQSGNLLVGTTSIIGSATGVLQVKGAASQNAMQVQIGTNGNNGILWYNASASAIGSIVVNSGSVAYNTTSDYRLKENIAPMTDALEKVSALKPVTYTWKATGESTQGFIAHELQEVCPDAVSGKKDAVDADGNPVYQGIDTSFLVATLTAAIQELKAINDAQAQTITALTARVTALETN